MEIQTKKSAKSGTHSINGWMNEWKLFWIHLKVKSWLIKEIDYERSILFFAVNFWSTLEN